MTRSSASTEGGRGPATDQGPRRGVELLPTAASPVPDPTGGVPTTGTPRGRHTGSTLRTEAPVATAPPPPAPAQSGVTRQVLAAVHATMRRLEQREKEDAALDSSEENDVYRDATHRAFLTASDPTAEEEFDSYVLPEVGVKPPPRDRSIDRSADAWFKQQAAETKRKRALFEWRSKKILARDLSDGRPYECGPFVQLRVVGEVTRKLPKEDEQDETWAHRLGLNVPDDEKIEGATHLLQRMNETLELDLKETDREIRIVKNRLSNERLRADSARSERLEEQLADLEDKRSGIVDLDNHVCRVYAALIEHNLLLRESWKFREEVLRQTADVLRRNPVESRPIGEAKADRFDKIQKRNIMVRALVQMPGAEERLTNAIANSSSWNAALYHQSEGGGPEEDDAAGPDGAFSHVDDALEEPTTPVNDAEPGTDLWKGIERLFARYKAVFGGRDKRGAVGLPLVATWHTAAPNMKCAPRPFSAVQFALLEEQIAMLEKLAIVEKRQSLSRWLSNPLLVKKKDGRWRFCVDYKYINTCITPSLYPSPSLKQIMQRACGSKFYFQADVRSCYFQLNISEATRELTTFMAPSRQLYHFLRLPMGLRDATAWCQQAMEIAFEPTRTHLYAHTGREIVVDDLIGWASTEEEILEQIEFVLKKAEKHNLKLSGQKCHFGGSSVEFLGHELSSTGLRPAPSRLEVIAKMTTPKDLRQLQQQLGFLQYVSAFVPNYATLAAPLHGLTAGDAGRIREWTPEHTAAHKRLIEAVLAAQVLFRPNPRLPWVIRSDASVLGAGAVLLQVKPNGQEQPLAFMSKQFAGAQKNWCTRDKEAYAAVHAFDHFRPIVYGHHVYLQTDHKGLKYMLTSDNEKITRWAMALGAYDWTLEYIPGQCNKVADSLSRMFPGIVQMQRVIASIHAQPRYNAIPPDLRGRPPELIDGTARDPLYLVGEQQEDTRLVGLARARIRCFVLSGTGRNSTEPGIDPSSEAAGNAPRPGEGDLLARQNTIVQPPTPPKPTKATRRKMRKKTLKSDPPFVYVHHKALKSDEEKETPSLVDPAGDGATTTVTRPTAVAAPDPPTVQVEPRELAPPRRRPQKPTPSAAEQPTTRSSVRETARRESTMALPTAKRARRMPPTSLPTVLSGGFVLEAADSQETDPPPHESRKRERPRRRPKRTVKAAPTASRPRATARSVTKATDSVSSDDSDFTDGSHSPAAPRQRPPQKKKARREDLDADIWLAPVPAKKRRKPKAPKRKTYHRKPGMANRSGPGVRRKHRPGYLMPWANAIPTDIRERAATLGRHLIRERCPKDAFWDEDDILRAPFDRSRRGGLPKSVLLVPQLDWYPPRFRTPASARINELKSILLTACHYSIEGGHGGGSRTLEKVLNVAYWEGIELDCTNFVALCPICKAAKYNPIPYVPPGSGTTRADYAGEVWQMDFIGPFDVDKHGNEYVLSCVDCCTRYCILVPTNAASAEIAIRTFNDDILTEGCPIEIRTDSGTHFVGKEFSERVERAGVKHHVIPGRHKTGMGLVERGNRVFNDTLRALVLELSHPDSWSEWVSGIQQVMNDSVNRVIGMTPFHAFRGKPYVSALKRQTDARPALTPQQPDPRDAADALADRIQLIEAHLARVRGELTVKAAVSGPFVVGDYVFRVQDRSSGLRKLDPRNQGPYRIEKVDDTYPDTFFIKSVVNPHHAAIRVHADTLMLYEVDLDPRHMKNFLARRCRSDDASSFFVPHMVRTHRIMDNGRVFFKVNWRFHGTEDDSWEPATGINNENHGVDQTKAVQAYAARNQIALPGQDGYSGPMGDLADGEEKPLR